MKLNIATFKFLTIEHRAGAVIITNKIKSLPQQSLLNSNINGIFWYFYNLHTWKVCQGHGFFNISYKLSSSKDMIRK